MPVFTGVFHRVEKKYLLDSVQYNNIVAELHSRMILDDYDGSGGRYSIRSLYYDTPQYAFIRQALSEPGYKEKLRLRTYGDVLPGDKVYVEIKKKIRGIGDKRRCKLPLEEAYRFIEFGVLFSESSGEGNMQVLSEIHRILHRHDMCVRPAALISYDRLAFNGSEEDPDLRISFDTNLLGRIYDLRFEYGSYGEPLVAPGFVVMEIKVLNALPFWLSRLLSENNAFARGFSKYKTTYHNKLISKEDFAYA